MNRWSYKQVVVFSGYGLDPKQLETLGRDGWELIAVVPVKSGMTYIFKRPLLEMDDAACFAEERKGFE